MIKQDIVNRVAEQLSITKVKAEIAVESVFSSLKNALKRGERIELRGFGVFIVKPRKSDVGRNPRTGEEVAIAEVVEPPPVQTAAVTTPEPTRRKPKTASFLALLQLMGLLSLGVGVALSAIRKRSS